MINFEYLKKVLDYVANDPKATCVEIEFSPRYGVEKRRYYLNCSPGDVVYNDRDYRDRESSFEDSPSEHDLIVDVVRGRVKDLSKDFWEEVKASYQEVWDNPEAPWEQEAYYALVMRSDGSFLPLPLLQEAAEREGDPALQEAHEELLEGGKPPYHELIDGAKIGAIGELAVEGYI